MDDEPVLGESRWLWPIVLFPYARERSHTRSFTGRAVLKDVKASLSRALLELTEENLIVRGRFTRREHLVIPLAEIRSVDIIDGKPGLIELRFSEADWGRLARIAISGAPTGSRNRVILNVNDTDTWLREIARRTR